MVINTKIVYNVCMRKWIEIRLKEIGKKKAGLARQLNLPFARVAEMIKGTRKLQTDEVAAFAIFMELSPEKVVQLFTMEDIENDSLADCRT